MGKKGKSFLLKTNTYLFHTTKTTMNHFNNFNNRHPRTIFLTTDLSEFSEGIRVRFFNYVSEGIRTLFT